MILVIGAEIPGVWIEFLSGFKFHGGLECSCEFRQDNLTQPIRYSVSHRGEMPEKLHHQVRHSLHRAWCCCVDVRAIFRIHGEKALFKFGNRFGQATLLLIDAAPQDQTFSLHFLTFESD